ncbi:hypothetical protein EB75_02010 [Mycobacterium sp. ST-F2]|nr:hypothetical protein EB75_02010 [Mycobacterium sp. ST-F2]
MPPNEFGRLDDELLPVVEPVVVDDPVVVLDVVVPPVVVEVSEPVVVPPVVVPPVDVPVVVPVVELVPVVPEVESLLVVSALAIGSENATAAAGANAKKPAVTRLEAAASRAWGITRRSPPLF